MFWDIIYYLLMFLEVVVCGLLVLLVLMQRPRQDGLGAAFGGGTMDQAFGAQTTNVLQRGTVYLGIAFFVLTFCLAVTVAHKNAASNIKSKSLVSEEDKKAAADAAAKAAAAKAAAPTIPTIKVNDSKPVTPPASTAPAPAAPAATPPPAPATPAAPKPAGGN